MLASREVGLLAFCGFCMQYRLVRPRGLSRNAGYAAFIDGAMTVARMVTVVAVRQPGRIAASGLLAGTYPEESSCVGQAMSIFSGHVATTINRDAGVVAAILIWLSALLSLPRKRCRSPRSLSHTWATAWSWPSFPHCEAKLADQMLVVSGLAIEAMANYQHPATVKDAVLGRRARRRTCAVRSKC